MVGEAVAPVDELWLSTYEGESVLASLEDRRSVLGVHGRLDLFAFDALKRVWEVLPLPQRLLLDLNRTTEVSVRAARAVVDLALREEQGPVVLVASDKHDEQVAAFSDRLPRCKGWEEVAAALGPPDGDVLARPTVRIRIEE